LTCAAVLETPDTPATSPFEPPASPSGAPTGTFGPGASAAPTITQIPDGPTATGPAPGGGEVLPAAPPGYDLLRRLGGGGMGVVYLAREQVSERLVAMKYLRFPGDQSALDRFVTELRVLVKLEHPNIVCVYAHDFLRADPYFTMEYAPGGPLSDALNGPMPAADAVRLIRTVAGAVASAHAEQVIHRDLKPSNILLAADGTPKVADYGLAKRLDQLDSVTRASGALGTPGYMPPEQISQSLGKIGEWSDVYGLGATLYHLLTGSEPFVAKSKEEVMLLVRTVAPRRPRSLNPAIPAGLEAVVLRCLEKSTRDRYQNVPELLADLDRYEAGEKTAAPELTRARRARLWVRENRVKIALAFGVVLLLGGAFVVGSRQRDTGGAKPEPTAAEKRQREHEALRDEFRAGRAARVLGEKGEPRYYDWVTGAAALGESPAGDGACYFQAAGGGSLLQLFEPPTDRYRLTLMIQQLGAEFGAEPTAPSVGVFLGHRALGRAAGPPAHGFLLAKFLDYDRDALLGGAATPQPVTFEWHHLVPRPGGLPFTMSAGLGHQTFGAKRTFPGPWWELTADVTPDSVVVRYSRDGAPPVELANLPREKVRVALGTIKVQAQLLGQQPGAQVDTGPVPADWTPTGGLGIWCTRSRVAFKNVTVSPLP
jgi:serine/threonine-protein kinase